jgi:hypothetical protein
MPILIHGKKVAENFGLLRLFFTERPKFNKSPTGENSPNLVTLPVWYIFCSFGTFFPVLVSCTLKNLATLRRARHMEAISALARFKLLKNFSLHPPTPSPRRKSFKK